MPKRRRSIPGHPKEFISAKRIIHVCMLIISGAIIGGIAFETILGVPASFIEAVAIVILVVIGVWFKEHI